MTDDQSFDDYGQSEGGRQRGEDGDVTQALGAHNYGSPRVATAMSRWGEEWLEHAPVETRDYVSRILGTVVR